MRPAALAATAVLVLAAGCGSTESSSPGPTITEIVAPPADQLVLQVEAGGGFVPVSTYALGRPYLSVYGDGRAFVTVDAGTVPPGTPVRLERASVPRPVVAEMLARAEATGLFSGEKQDLGNPGITDTATTKVTFRPGYATAREVSAYALYYDDDDKLTDRQREGRRELRNLIRSVDDATTRDPTSSPWRPDRIDVTQLDVRTRTGDARRWPGPALATVLRETERGPCGVVSGAVAKRIYESALEHGNTEWRDGKTVRPLAIRALLPGERGC